MKQEKIWKESFKQKATNGNTRNDRFMWDNLILKKQFQA